MSSISSRKVIFLSNKRWLSCAVTPAPTPTVSKMTRGSPRNGAPWSKNDNFCTGSLHPPPQRLKATHDLFRTLKSNWLKKTGSWDAATLSDLTPIRCPKLNLSFSNLPKLPTRVCLTIRPQCRRSSESRQTTRSSWKNRSRLTRFASDGRDSS